MNWSDVMAKLTGARLAALDALQRQGERSAVRVAMDCERHAVPEIVEAVCWLCAHHLATQTAPGLFRARQVAVARECFERAGGPLVEFLQGLRGAESAPVIRTGAEQSTASAPVFVPANAAPSGVRVQDYQVQMFSEV